MNIRTDSEGNILAWGEASELPGSEPYAGDVPADFAENANAYKMEGGEIVEKPVE